MKIYLKIIYCLMEAAIDCSAWIRTSYYKKHYGKEWKEKLKETLRSNIDSQLNMLSVFLWFTTSCNLIIITGCLIDSYVLKNGNDGLSVVFGFIVTLVILAPYYIWRRKNYEKLIVKHEYIVDAPHFSRMQKVVALCGMLVYGITPLFALVVFAPLTSR